MILKEDLDKIYIYLREHSVKDSELEELKGELSKNDYFTIVSNGKNMKVSVDEVLKNIQDKELEIADSNHIGGVKPVDKTSEMTQDVGIDKKGRLFTTPGGKDVDLNYHSNIDNKDITTPNKIGGIDAGISIRTLETYDFNKLFDDLLFPTIYPTFVDPSTKLSLKDYNPVQKVGSNSPNEITNFIKSFNRGEILLNDVHQDFRAGELKDSSIYVDNPLVTLPPKVKEGDTKYYYKVTYEEGPQPKDNKGNNYSNPLASGNVISSAVTINGTYPIFKGTRISNNEIDLIKWSSNMIAEFELPAHSKEDPIIFKLPKRQLKTIWQMGVSKYEEIDKSNWNKTEEIIDINGNSVTYYVYTFNKKEGQGRVEIKVQF